MHAQNIGRTKKGKITHGHKNLRYSSTYSNSQQKQQKNIHVRTISENDSTYSATKTKNKQKKKCTPLLLQAKNQKSHLLSHSTSNCSARTASREPTATGRQDTPTDDVWGHNLSKKGSNMIRILLQNTGGIDHKPGGSVKLAALYEFMQEAHVDIAALTECNTAWNKCEYSELPSQQTKYWWENAHWSIGHNKQDPDSALYQPGGTSIVVVNKLSHWAQRPGDDKTGLGRWCWARLRGKNNRQLRLVSVYRPCPANGPLSTYQQQIRHWSAQNIDCCPREKLLADLKEEVALWQAEGDQVIILADMNDDVNAAAIQHFCEELHLVEAISTLHGPAQKPTHQRGRQAIDGIYMSRSLLQGARGGFLQFGDVMGSDHRAVWVDISAELVGMAHQEPIISPARRRLKCGDPRIVKKYNQVLLRAVQAEGWEQRMTDLYEAASNNTWSSQHLLEYNDLDKEYIHAKVAAEKGCRKFRAGRQPWTPALTQAIQRILYWKGIYKRARGGKTSTTVLKRRATKGQLQFSSEHWSLPQKSITQRIVSAYDDYH